MRVATRDHAWGDMLINMAIMIVNVVSVRMSAVTPLVHVMTRARARGGHDHKCGDSC